MRILVRQDQGPSIATDSCTSITCTRILAFSIGQLSVLHYPKELPTHPTDCIARHLVVLQAINFNNQCAAGLLRESVLHRYAQYCNRVRERLLIDQ